MFLETFSFFHPTGIGKQRRAEAAQQASEAALAISAAAHEEHAAASERALRDLRIHVKMKEVSVCPPALSWWDCFLYCIAVDLLCLSVEKRCVSPAFFVGFYFSARIVHSHD